MGQDFQALFNCFTSVGTCFLLSCAYLGSFYVWNTPYNRDHPSTIKKRFVSVFFMLFLSPCFLYLGLNKQILEKVPFLEILGLRRNGFCQATIIPLVLTMVLFSGPIFMEICNRFFRKKQEGGPVVQSNVKDLVWIRNHLVAPFSEEFTYRSCMMPLLLQCLPPTVAILTNPLLFGIAHLHHMRGRVQCGLDLSTALKVSCAMVNNIWQFSTGFQFVYTSLFGMYSAYLLYKTGHFVSVFVVHAFCNHMGFPDLVELVGYEKKKQAITGAIFVAGLVCWCFLLRMLTNSELYENSSAWYFSDEIKNHL